LPLSVRHAHFAVGHFLGYVVFPHGGTPDTVQHPVNSSLRVSPSTECYPLQPSLPTAVSELLSWAFLPYSTCQDRRSTCRGFCLPATFRLQGLVTLVTAYSRRSLAGFFSHRQRSWDSPFEAFSSRKVSRRFTAGRNPHTVFPADHHTAEAECRHNRLRFLGSCPSRVPGDYMWC
jgi:hypothetical protein